MRFGVEDRRIDRERLYDTIARRRFTCIYFPLGRELIDVIAVHLFLALQLREPCLVILTVEHEQPDEDLVANRLGPARRPPQPRFQRASSLRRDRVHPPADMPGATIEPPLDESAGAQVLKSLVDLPVIRRPEGSDTLLEFRLDPVSVELLPIEQPENGISKYHGDSFRAATAAALRGPLVLARAGDRGSR